MTKQLFQLRRTYKIYRILKWVIIFDVSLLIKYNKRKVGALFQHV